MQNLAEAVDGVGERPDDTFAMKTRPSINLRAAERFGTNVVLLREKSRLTQVELAAASRVSVRTIASVEASNPGISLERASRIADTLGQPLGRLIDEVMAT